MNFWGTIKKDENWALTDTDTRNFEDFDEMKFFDRGWIEKNWLDRSMKRDSIIFHSGWDFRPILHQLKCIKLFIIDPFYVDGRIVNWHGAKTLFTACQKQSYVSFQVHKLS